MANQTFAQIYPVYTPGGTEQKVASDPIGGNFLLVQNNTAYDCNLLVWKESTNSGQPLEFALRAGGSVTYGGKLGYFEVYTAGTNNSALGVKPAGFAGGYHGRGAVTQTGTVGYFSVVAWDAPVPINIPQSNFSDVAASISGALPTGYNHIGSVAVDQLSSLPAGNNLIGHVIVDNMTSSGGPASSVSVDGITAPLAAGTNHIGSVAVDQLPALPAGANNIGNVGVSSLPALPAGSNLIGHVIVDNMTSGSGSSANLNTFGIKGVSRATVGTVAVAIPVPANVNTITIKNLDASNTIYFGSDNTVTTANGWPLEAGREIVFDEIDPTLNSFNVYAISTANVNVAIMGVK